jgi:hypothetical protein
MRCIGKEALSPSRRNRLDSAAVGALTDRRSETSFARDLRLLTLVYRLVNSLAIEARI